MIYRMHQMKEQLSVLIMDFIRIRCLFGVVSKALCHDR